MTKEEKIAKAMKDSGVILDLDDAERAIEFVRDLLEIDAEETEINEPYATDSIAKMKLAIESVSNLTTLIGRD
jgi:hypothetical protein